MSAAGNAPFAPHHAPCCIVPESDVLYPLGYHCFVAPHIKKCGVFSFLQCVDIYDVMCDGQRR